jgi:hypothetical protein
MRCPECNKFAGLESPYFVEATISDLTGYSVSATVGGIVAANRSHSRTPEVQVRGTSEGVLDCNESSIPAKQHGRASHRLG